MLNMKKITIYKILLIILIIIAIVLVLLVINKNIESNKTETQAQQVLEKIRISAENDSISENLNITEDGLETVEPRNVVKEINEQIEGYNVIGIIKIPKINIEYPILEKTDKTSLNLSITKFWGEKVNQIGNLVLAGHNNLNDRMFGKINKLENGDIIELTDSQLVTVKYEVFSTYIVDPNDINCILPENENLREVTLITCTNGNADRLVVKACEIK